MNIRHTPHTVAAPFGPYSHAVEVPEGSRLLYISGEVGVAKPARRIYEILFERTGLRPEELLFVDDSLANVAAAEALGMAAIHYREGIDLDAELRARGVLG